jgi:Ser/Thr protein kinase RdoA (MazF antagonist)
MPTIPPHPLARGRTADVYAWEHGQVLKLFHDWFALEDIEYELRIARAVHASGVQAPAVGELIRVEERNGLVYERVVGKPMMELLPRQPWKLFGYARQMPHIHAQMHERVFTADVPPLEKKLEYKLNHAESLPASLRADLLAALKSMPGGDRVCHGDFHPANVLVNGSETRVIDWIDASRGNPLADVARTTVIFEGAIAGRQISNPLERVALTLFHTVYRREYFRLRPGGMDEYRRWIPIVAGARLSENIVEIQAWLLQKAGKIRGNDPI